MPEPIVGYGEQPSNIFTSTAGIATDVALTMPLWRGETAFEKLMYGPRKRGLSEQIKARKAAIRARFYEKVDKYYAAAQRHFPELKKRVGILGGGYSEAERLRYLRIEQMAASRSYTAGRVMERFGRPSTYSDPAIRSARRGLSKIGMASKFWRGFGWAGFVLGSFVDLGFNVSRELMRPELARESILGEEMNSNAFNDNYRTYTGRQRSLMAIHNSQLHARAVLGNEAMYMGGLG